VEQISFVSRDVPGDISTVAKLNRANLVLMGFHKPVIGKTILGGTVHRVLQHCNTDVAIFVDRGFRTARRILVPYLGSDHDKLAIALAHRMAKNIEAQVTVLHVVPPMRSDDGQALGAKQAVDKIFEQPTHKTPVTLKVIEDESPVGVVLHQAQTADLVIIGVAEEWGLESHLFGWRPEKIARDCPSSLLIVRKHSLPAQASTPSPIGRGQE
jgi:nucleotide-binding universal stress UspA family protein